MVGDGTAVVVNLISIQQCVYVNSQTINVCVLHTLQLASGTASSSYVTTVCPLALKECLPYLDIISRRGAEEMFVSSVEMLIRVTVNTLTHFRQGRTY